MTEQMCQNCRFWDEREKHEGKCRRRAPIAAVGDDYLDEIAKALKLLLWWTMREWSDEKTANKQLEDFALENFEEVFHLAQWPTTLVDHWCGEWEPRTKNKNEQQVAA